MNRNSAEKLVDNKAARSRFSQAAKRKMYSAVAAATLMALVTGQSKAAILLVALVIPLGIWFAYSLYVIITQPHASIPQAICVALWIGAIVVVLLIHFVRYVNARQDANEVVKAIVDASKTLKHCPLKLENLVIKRPDLKDRMRADFTYSCTAGKPRFFYQATFTVFDTFEYDFSRGVWEYRSWINKNSYMERAVGR